MSLSLLPVEVLFSIVKDHDILDARDVFNLLLTDKHLSRCLRSCLFRNLVLGEVSDMRPFVAISKQHTFDPLLRARMPQQADAYYHRPPDFLTVFLEAMQKGYIVKDDLGYVRHLTLTQEVNFRLDVDASHVSPGELSARRKLYETFKTLIRALTGLRALHIQYNIRERDVIRSFAHRRAIFGSGILNTFPGNKIKTTVTTDDVGFLEFLQNTDKLCVTSLSYTQHQTNIPTSDPLFGRAERVILSLTELEELTVTKMHPWSESTATDRPRPVSQNPFLNDDLPKLQSLTMNSSPNFVSLPVSLLKLFIDIGPDDMINHHCFPIFCSLPNLRVFRANNRQLRLPQYSHNPTASPPVGFTAFSQLRSAWLGLPRPQEKVFFIPPRSLFAIIMCNPYLEHIYYSCICASDLQALSQATCHSTLRSLEIQSDVWQSTPGETGFVTADLVELFNSPRGVPNLQSLKWACNNRKEMALSAELAQALFPAAVDDTLPTRKHNLKILAIENRVPKPKTAIQRIPDQAPVPLTGDVFVERRQLLKKTCTYVEEVEELSSAAEPSSSSTLAVRLNDCMKNVSIMRNGKPITSTANRGAVIYQATPDCLFIEAEPVGDLYIVHEGLHSGEKRLLAEWRKLGGCVWEVVWTGPDIGKVNNTERALWEELFFVDLHKLRDLARSIWLERS